jgi:hypothetical protein
MRVPVRALCVLTACSAIAGVAAAPAEAREPFDVALSNYSAHYPNANHEPNGPYVRNRPGGSVKFDRFSVVNLGPGRAPATTFAFRWKKKGANVKTVSVGALDDHARWESRPVRVPLPSRNGRYYLWACANTPPVKAPERNRNDNCSKLPHLVIMDRQAPVLLSVAPTSWDFGSVPVGTSAEAQNFTVRNLGPGDTGSGGAFVAGSGAGAFDIPTNGCIAGLSGTSACRIRVIFTPFAAGSYTEDLVITFPRGGELRVPLTGTGT